MSAHLCFAGSLLLNLILAPAPPATRVEPVIDEIHGERLSDNYRWLEAKEADSAEVKEWTTKQNDYTRSVVDHLPGRPALEKRLSSLMTIDRTSLPAMRGNLYFYEERKGDENQAILYVREGAGGAPRVLINPNKLSERGLCSLDWFSPSQDGSRLAFGISYSGSEMSVLHVMDVRSGQWLADEIPGKVNISGWTPDSAGFMYGRLKEPADAYSRIIQFHAIGTYYGHDPVLMTQTEPSKVPGASLSDDGRWIIPTVFNGWSRNDLSVVDADAWRRTGEFKMTPIAVGLDARFSPEVVHGDTLYMLTTLDAPNGIVYAVDLNNPGRDRWKVIIRHRDDAVLAKLDHARGILVARYARDATSQFERFDMAGQSLGAIELPGLGTAAMSTYDDRTEGFLRFTSYNEPVTIYHVELASPNPKVERTVWARPQVPVDGAQFQVKQEWFTSRDGTKVPMFVVHRKGLKLDGNNACLLYGYGGFNASITPTFIPTIFPWLESGGVYAVANLRGGGEYGEAWHKAGMLANKQNVFDDFYAAAEHLIQTGYTNSKRLACQGGSNGGLLTGVAVTQRPELFTAAICSVPLLDMLRYQNFLMARFWVPEYGSAENLEQFKWLRAYSPYQNIKAGAKYPAVLFTAGENDNRVHPLHARKMVAALQATASNDISQDPILLWVDRDAGHGEGKPLTLRIRDAADTWSFLMWQTGLTMKQ